MLARFCNAKRDICASEALPQQRLSSNGFAKRGVPSPQFPEIGRRKEALPVAGALRLVVGDDILDYDLSADDVAITSIRHTRQLDPDMLYDADFDLEEEVGGLRSAEPPSDD